MGSWFVEEGIGEHRAARILNGRVIEARIEVTGALMPGWVVEARLLHKSAGSTRGTAVTADGTEEILLDHLPRDAQQGAPLRVEVTRAALAGPGRLKRAQGRPTEVDLMSPSLAQRLSDKDGYATVVRRFPACDWDELVGEVLDAAVPFNGGSLLFAPTPAMVAIDVDGDLPGTALALAAVGPLAKALRRFDLGGSIVIDFPTLAKRDDRRAIDTALEAALVGWPHERTAMNGFGLVQIVARQERPSLLHLASWQRRSFAWRNLLRRAEALEGPGSIELAISPALAGLIQPVHIDELERRTGKCVRIHKVAQLVPETPNVQLVPDD